MSTHLYWQGPNDKQVWDLRDGPVRVSNKGVQGLGMVPKDAFVRASASTDGQKLLGTRASARTILLPVIVNHSLPRDQWQEWDQRWWRSFDFRDYGTLYVVNERNTTRTIQCRFVGDGPYEFTYDPSDEGMSTYVMELVADDPWFRGEPVSFTVQPPPDPIPFFGPAGEPGEVTPMGPPFYITSSGTVGYTELMNPGDEDAWPIWDIYGPAASFYFVVAGRKISGTIPVPDGYRLEIDTRPNRKTVRLYAPDGSYVSKARNLDPLGMNYTPIPSMDTVPVQIVTSGGGVVRVSFDPIYRKGF